MPSRSNVSQIRHSLITSSVIHLLIVAMFVALTFTKRPEPAKTLEFAVLEKVRVAPDLPATPVVNIEKPLPPKPTKPAREVFGVSRKSLTSTTGEAVKAGNTVAKAPDKETLKDDDQDSLPIPADEFLITAMPSVEVEVRPEYPASAKKDGTQGRVVFEILIDEKGIVRQAEIIQSLGDEFDQAARQAIMKFRFRPARMDKNAVAVKIRYAINFRLER